jgi:hypothetical protein
MRNHVRREFRRQEFSQLAERKNLGSVCGLREVCYQSRGLLLGLSHDNCLTNRSMVDQRLLDLSQLDAVAMDLHLIVGAAQVLNAPIGAIAPDVTGAIHARARFVAIGIRYKSFGCRVRAAQISTSQTIT